MSVFKIPSCEIRTVKTSHGEDSRWESASHTLWRLIPRLQQRKKKDPPGAFSSHLLSYAIGTRPDQTSQKDLGSSDASSPPAECNLHYNRPSYDMPVPLVRTHFGACPLWIGEGAMCTSAALLQRCSGKMTPQRFPRCMRGPLLEMYEECMKNVHVSHKSE